MAARTDPRDPGCAPRGAGLLTCARARMTWTCAWARRSASTSASSRSKTACAPSSTSAPTS
eukprot:2199300-Rhodomonas_salina.1